MERRAAYRPNAQPQFLATKSYVLRQRIAKDKKKEAIEATYRTLSKNVCENLILVATNTTQGTAAK